MTDTSLVAWLTEKLDDAERVANAALWAGDERWLVLPGQEKPFHRPWQVIDGTYEEGLVKVEPHAADDEGVARFIAANDPVQRLAEVDVKRQILALHAENIHHECEACNERQGGDYPCQTIRLVALPFADRAGYRADWEPSEVTA
jgi:hypothetical protein